ncbi:MAG: hypothetical protein U1A27_07060 [Phycisphaerae bacterium]
MSVPLGDGSVTADANTGIASRPSSVWSVFANSPVAPLSLLGPVVSHAPGFIYRIQLGASGEVTQIFDNELFAPEMIGEQIVLDNQGRSIPQPLVMYVAESYGTESGSSVSLVKCLDLFIGPLTLVNIRIEFEGTFNMLFDRIDGTLRVVIEPSFIVGLLPPAQRVQAETIEVSAFAMRDDAIIPPGIPTLITLPTIFGP